MKMLESREAIEKGRLVPPQHTHNAQMCNTLQHTATYCNTLQQQIGVTKAHIQMPESREALKQGRFVPSHHTHNAQMCNTLQHTTTYCNTLQQQIGVTKAHIQMPESREAIEKGRLVPDGKILLPDGSCVVTKAAIEHVWHLPGGNLTNGFLCLSLYVTCV